MERETEREQHVCAVTMWCGSILYRYYRLEFDLTMSVPSRDVLSKPLEQEDQLCTVNYSSSIHLLN